jgi:peptidyl-prolyl cis-trans isomerase C
VKKTTLFITAFALAGSLAMAQEKVAPAAAAAPKLAEAQPADPVIITAGAITITKSEFETAVKTLPEQYQQYAMAQGRKQFAEDFLRLKLLAGEGMRNGLDKDPDVIKQMGLLRENLVAQAQLGRIEKGIVISDADAKAAYDANQKDYEQLHARHILIAFKGSPAAQTGKKELTEDEAKAKAEDIRKKLTAGGKFEDLAKTESDDITSAVNGGDLGNFGHGQMVPEFEKVAFSTKPGETSDVVRTQFGYHIIKVESKDVTPFAGVKDKLEHDLHQKKLQDALDKLKTDAQPQFNEAYFAAPPPPSEPKADSPADKAATAKPASAKPAPKDAHPVGEKHP